MTKIKIDVTNGRIPISRIELGDVLLSNSMIPLMKKEEVVIEVENLQRPDFAKIVTARKKGELFVLHNFRGYIPSQERFEFEDEQDYKYNTIGYEKARMGLLKVGVRI